MFYIQLGANGLDVRVKITDENVFTDCPVCGKPLDVDITEIEDLYGTSIYCTECFEKQKGEKRC